MNNKFDLNRLFTKEIENNSGYNQALKLIKLNSNGKIWLIGGFVYRTLARLLYQAPKPKVDLDFIIERPTKKLDLSKGWVVKRNRFGNPKIINKKIEIDYIPLDNIYSIIYRGLEPKIENFLSGVPLTIQSIAYDVGRQKIIGEKGIRAIKKREIEANNLYFLKYAAKKKRISVEEYIQEKAEDLGFIPIYPSKLLIPKNVNHFSAENKLTIL